MILLRMILLVPMSLALVSLAQAAPVPVENVELKSKKLEELWKLLLLADEEPASAKALLELSARPKAEVVGFLGEKLKPIKITKDKLEKLIGELGGENEEAADAAFTELGYFDPRLELDLETIMKFATSKRHKQRMVALMFSQPLAEANKYVWCDVEYNVINNPAAAAVEDRMQHGFSLNNDPNKPAGFQTELDRMGNPGGMLRVIPSSLSKLRLSQWNRATRAIMVLELLRTPEAIAVMETMATGHPVASPTKAATEALTRLNKK